MNFVSFNFPVQLASEEIPSAPPADNRVTNDDLEVEAQIGKKN